MIFQSEGGEDDQNESYNAALALQKQQQRELDHTFAPVVGSKMEEKNQGDQLESTKGGDHPAPAEASEDIVMQNEAGGENDSYKLESDGMSPEKGTDGEK